MRPDRFAITGLFVLLVAPFLAGAQESKPAPIIFDGYAAISDASGDPIIAGARGNVIDILRPSSDPNVRFQGIGAFSEPEGPVRALAIRPDGRTLASGGDGKVVRMREIPTGKETTVLKGHDGAITCLAFTPDGKSLASGSLDSSVTVWDLSTGKERIALARHTSAITALAFSKDGKRLASGSLDWTAKVWDVVSGKLIQSLAGHRGPVVALAFAPDGKTLATTSRDGLARLWDLEDETQKFAVRAHAGSTGPLAFLPDGRSLIAGGVDGTLRRWDVEDGHVQGVLLHAHNGPIRALAVSPDGKMLASYDDTSSRTWDIAGKLGPMPFAGVEAKVRSLALSPDGKILASSTTEGFVQLWETARGRQKGEPIALDSHDIRLAFSHDGRILAALPIGAVLRFWDPTSGREEESLAVEPNHSIRCFAFGPDGRSLVTVGSRMMVWNLDNDPPFRTFRESTGLVRAVAWSREGKTIAAARGDGSIELWDVARGVATAKLEGHEAAVACLAESPDGRFLASGSWDRTVRLWNARDGSQKAVLRGPTRPLTDLAFTSDGKTLASAADDDPTIWFFDVDEGRPAATLTLPDAVKGEGFSCLAFSPDGRTLYTGGDHGIAAWDVSESSKVLDHRPGPPGRSDGDARRDSGPP